MNAPLQDVAVLCERCNDGTTLATTHQEYRETGDRAHWPNRSTDRCDSCALALRQYVALPSIRDSMNILVDVPLAVVRA